jgi:primase-polymerase (primpol)-like protein
MRCDECGGPLPLMARKHATTCSPRCRKRRSRAGVPQELRERPRWVTHTEAKVPLTPDDRPASSTNPGTWSTYEQVKALPRQGFVLDGDGIVCVDLDHCLTGGRLAGWAAEILAACPSTYVEVSVSGTGLHIFGHAEVGAGRKIRDHRSVEVYGTGRFIAVTGRRWRGAPGTLADISALVDSLSE